MPATRNSLADVSQGSLHAALVGLHSNDWGIVADALHVAMLIREGLYPSSKVLDIGCGCLRGGYWLIHFLDRACYFGIEPDREMLHKGIESLLEPGLLESKQPRFDMNGRF